MSIEIPSELREELWEHQRKAIDFALHRLRGVSPKAASLVRMPTGTGKTGVIGVLCVAAPPEGWSLILTPWKHLCVQMIDDLTERFWKARGWSPTQVPKIERLYPKNLATVLEKSGHWILVGTFASLVTIFKRQRKKYEKLSGKLAQVFVDEGHYEPAVEWGQAVNNLRPPLFFLPQRLIETT